MPSAGSATRSCSSASTRSWPIRRSGSAWPRWTRSRRPAIREPPCPRSSPSLDDPVADVRVAAARILAAFETAPPGVVEVLATDSARAQAAALTALVGHGPEVRPQVVEWAGGRLTRANDLRRARLALGDVAATPETAFLAAILEHRERDLANLALGALVVLGAPEAGGVIRRCLRSRDTETRAQAIEALESIGEPRLSGALIGLLEEAPAEPQDRADALRRLADDDDPWIARVARTISTGGADMPETSRTLGDLETMLCLRRVPLFEGLDPEDLQRIASTAIEHVYPAGEPLVREGDVGDTLIVIVEGSVRVVKAEPDGSERLIRTYDGGRPHRRARGPTRGATRGDRPRRGRRRPRAGHRRRRPQGDPARAPGCRDGDARHARRADQQAIASVHGRNDPSEVPPAPALPVGTVTFLRTDVEGSMALARTLGAGWDAVNATHMGLLRAAVDGHGGVVVRTEGDALFAVFPEAGAAVRGGGRRAAGARRARLAGDGAGPRPDRAPHAARRTSPATTTAASTSTARLGSPRSGTVARSSCPAPPPTLVADALPAGTSTQRPRTLRPQGRATPRAPRPARRRGPAERVPAPASRPGDGRQP